MTQRNTTIAQQIHQALTVLYTPDQVVELRIPKVDGKKQRTDSGYFNDLNALAIAAARYEGRASGVYVTLNPVEPALLARAENRVKEYADLATTDEYITGRRWLPIDCDPKVNGKKRPAGISSTEQEHESATRKAQAIREWLSTAGWPDPVEADSGNGAALLYAIDLPNTDDSKELIEACLKALAQRFDDKQCDIDTTVHNAARIWKVYGTIAGKGDSTTDRPHRRAALTNTPYPIRAVSIGLLQALAKTIEQSKPAPLAQNGRTGIQAEQWLRSHNVAVSSTKPGNNGGTIYLLEECPFNADHAGSATVVQMASGALSFRCLHDSCKTYDWRSLRSKFEPGVYEHRNGTTPNTPATPAASKPAGAALRSETVMQTLLDLGYSFRLNLCDDTIEVNGRAIDNVVRATLLTVLHDRDLKGRATLEDTWTAAAAQSPYHPIKDYLNSCIWDGKPYIEELSSYFTCTDAPIVYHDGSAVPLVSVYLWRWLIGAAAKVFEQAQNLMLVMAGPQGSGKSSFVRWLCKNIPQAHIESPITVGDRDTDVRLMKYFLWEVSELDATTRKADVSALKAFITKQTVNARKAYGHYDTVKPASASLFGTVNDGSGFLADETGNRRFYVTTISAIDWRYTTLPIDQIWGQAVALWRKGEPWQLQPNELKAQVETNKQHEIDGLLEDWIQRYFILAGDENEGMSAAEIVDHLRKGFDIRLSGSDRAQAMEVARVMTKFGIRKRQRDGKGAREYIGVMTK